MVRRPHGLLIASASQAWQLAGKAIIPTKISLPALDPTGTCFNDGKFDRHGHLWLGPSDTPEKETLGRLWRIAPDGSTVEMDAGFNVSNGRVYSCRWGGGAVLVLSPQGDEIDQIDVPATNMTSAAFSGEALNHLFITTASIDSPSGSAQADGAVFVAKEIARGLPEPVFEVDTIAKACGHRPRGG